MASAVLMADINRHVFPCAAIVLVNSNITSLFLGGGEGWWLG